MNTHNILLKSFCINKELLKENACHIAFTGTSNYIPWIGVAMTSIMMHNPASSFAFHVLLDHLPQDEMQKLNSFSQKWQVPIFIYIMNDAYISTLCHFSRYIINGKFVAAFLYRFFVPDLISEISSRVLYLDGDIVCNGSISEFMTMNIGNHIVATAPDLKCKEYATRFSLSNYFNAGIILINIDQWMKKNITSLLLETLNLYQSQNIDLPCADQDILNIVLKDNTFFVSRKYNMPYRLVRPSLFKKSIKNENPSSASLIHFIGAIKPWTTYNQTVPIVRVWAEAKANSPWAETPLHSPASQKAIHQAARAARSDHAYLRMIGLYLKFIKSKFDGTPKHGY